MKPYIVVALALIFFGEFLFVIGIHNIDISVNMKYGSFDSNNYITRDKIALYMDGIDELIFAETLQLVGVLLLLWYK